MTRKNKEKIESIRWNELTKKQQNEYLLTAKRIVSRELKLLKESYGDNVVTMAEGFRTKGTKKRVFRELVIRVYVKTKWPKEKKFENGEHLVPPYFSGYLQRGRKRIKIKIPTDVNALDNVTLQGTNVSVTGDGHTEKGSICCLVRDKKYKNSIFLLSCKHVFCLAHHSHAFTGIKDVKIDLYDLNNKYEYAAHVAKREDLASTDPNHHLYSLDAAIAHVDNYQKIISSRINGVRATKILKNFKLIKVGDNLKIYTCNGTINVIVVATPENMLLPYPNNVNLLFRRIIEYKPYPLTQGGDSGSALMDGTILVGMHFALVNEVHGYAMFADDIFRRGTFGRDIELVKDHNIN